MRTLRPASRNAGFSLFEVLIAVTIFLLLAGGIFTSLRAAFIASTEVASQQIDSERLNAFEEFLRRIFLSLPPDAKVELNFRQQSGLGDVVEVLVWPAPAFLQFGTDSSDGAAISAQPDGKGGFDVKLGYFNSEDSKGEREQRLDQEAKWDKVLSGVKQIRWRMAPARNPVYSDTWAEGAGRPGLVELALEMNTGESTVYQFWVPPLQRRSNAGSAPPVVSGQPGAAVPPGGKPPGGAPPPGSSPPPAE